MLNVTKLVVQSYNLDHLDVFWEIEALPYGDAENHDIFNYTFTVLRSEAAMGPYDKVGGPFRDVYHFRDTSVSMLHKWRQYYYKLKVTHLPSGEEQESGISASGSSPPDLIAAEIVRQEDVLFREFIGRRCVLFPARTFGPHCSCWDPVLQKKTRSAHLPCYGTGWLGGFMSPVECFIQIDPSPKQIHLTQWQEKQPGDTSGRMISFPPISPRDILVEAENRRWRVVSVSYTSRLRSVVHQELQLREVSRGDVEFALPINVDPTASPSAERNFTNPQNLENDGDYSDILAAFGHGRGMLR